MNAGTVAASLVDGSVRRSSDLSRICLARFLRLEHEQSQKRPATPATSPTMMHTMRMDSCVLERPDVASAALLPATEPALEIWSVTPEKAAGLICRR